MFGTGQSRETERRGVVARGWDEGHGDWGVTADEFGVFWGEENGLKLDNGDSCTIF